MSKIIAKILGWMTLTGFVLIVVAVKAHDMDVAYPLPITLLCAGAFCFLVAGIPWAHTQGKRGLKTVFLGVVGFAGGGAAGLFLGEAAAPSGEKNLGTAILALIFGFWVGAVAFGSLGVWWGISFHRRFGPDGKADGNRTTGR